MTALVELGEVVKRFGPDGPPALAGVSGEVPAGRVTGLVGADGAGKTTLMRLMAGLLAPDGGGVVAPPAAEIGYMPQRFGLYEDLTVAENLRLYADLRGLPDGERPAVLDRLYRFTALGPFADRLAGNLSGGMKQKLGLACALVATPRLLLLDEPSVGVDPVSRRELWRMVHDLAGRGIGVVWSTAYLDEAERCDRVLLLDEGRVVYDGPPKALTARVAGRCFALSSDRPRRDVQAEAAGTPAVVDALIQGASVRVVMAADSPPPAIAAATARPVPPRFEDAFVSLLQERGHDRARHPTVTMARRGGRDGPLVEARDLVRRFGDFVAVGGVSFTVAAGEIFGLLGPNGAGKSTTFKMLCGLLPPSSGAARVAGIDLAAARARQRLGYMSQRFSLYPDLSVRQNLDFFAGVYGAPRGRPAEMVEAFELGELSAADAGALPLGFKQRLALACAVMHRPDVLFLDEPTSGVDPLTRRDFWRQINAMAAEGVAVLVTTHFLDEAEYCDRIGIVHGGRLIAQGSPAAIKDGARGPGRPDPTLEDAFVALIEAEGGP